MSKSMETLFVLLSNQSIQINAQGHGTEECIHIRGPLCSCCINKKLTKTHLVGRGLND